MDESITDLIGIQARTETWQKWEPRAQDYLSQEELDLFLHTQAKVREQTLLEAYYEDVYGKGIQKTIYRCLDRVTAYTLKAIKGRTEWYLPTTREKRELTRRFEQVGEEARELYNSPEYLAAKGKLMSPNGPLLFLGP